MKRGAQTDRGAALVTVLTMLAVMSTLAIVVVDAANMSMRRTGNLVRMEQTRWYLMGAEAFAASRIETLQRAAEIGRIDQAEWQSRPFTFPLDDGAMRVTLRDGSNCFNLNSMVQGETETNANAAAIMQFARLLDLLGVRSDRVGLGAALADWIDTDREQSPGGAEDGVRDGAPYRPANTLMADVSELARVQGFDDGIVSVIAAYVCVRPTTAPNRINPNTLRPEDAPLLAMLLPDVGVEDARRVIRDRPPGGWQNLDSFFAHPRLVGLEMNDLRRGSFSMQTAYYVMTAQVERDGARESGAALIRATPGGGGVVVRRLFGVGLAERPL
ncbi:MAG: type II secretion system minor pseudopilin GspK [Hyphomonadaceae bacterium]|nr:type II secretion system minor pseudopilin GspK [Hyphomonadaceae bacterium]